MLKEGGVIEEKTRAAKVAARPARRWRNRWCVAVRYRNCYNGQWVGPGEYCEAFVCPSKKIAEQIAHEDLDRHASFKRVMKDKYLGALSGRRLN
jgi:hypothetical protein